MIMDKEERLNAKKKLDEKQAQLQEEIAQMRRALAQLNEQNAANKLNDAMEKLDKAAEQAKQGNNPDADLKNAKDEINRAKQELKEAEEQLARELLIKIADQLEGLKMRQASMLERSESLHSKVMKKKQWTDPYLDSIEGNIDSQKDIAGETDTFKDKLKEAKVFHDILGRAKGSMDEAVGVMNERREEGKDRRENKFNDEQMKDEIDWHKSTVKHQKAAVDRLDRLLEALKEEIAKNKTKQPDNQGDNAGNGEQPPEQGGIQPQDGIPGKAQLKALYLEQLDLNKRTEEFAKANPDPTKLNDAQKRELRELSEEQQRIHELFQGLVARPMQPMPMPELKEGGKQ
jgi:hypothetical protein